MLYFTLWLKYGHYEGNSSMIKTKEKPTEIVWYDSNPCSCGYTYEDYVEHCEINECTPSEDNSQDYWRYVDRMLQNDYNEYLISYIVEEINKKHDLFILCGTLGLWNGKPDIYPEIYNDIGEIIKKITNVRFNYYLKVSYDINNKEINIEQSHHDGCNCFTIKALKNCSLTDYFVNMYNDGMFIFQEKRNDHEFFDILNKNNLFEDIQYDHGY